MSQDPFLQREAEKYEFPVPSREFILEHLAKREKPVSREELAQEFNITGEDQIEGLRRRLRAMERDGQLIFTRRQCYALPERLDLLRGTVIGHRDGFGFLRVEGRKDDLYLSAEQMKMAIHGDVVMAQPLGEDRRGRREGRIVRVLVPKTSQIVGRYFVDAGSAFVVPDDSRLSFDILIPPEGTAGARMGSVVVVELTQRPTRRTKAIGKVVEILGENMGTGMAVDIAVRTHDIPYTWPPEVEEQIASLKEEVPAEAKRGRVDLRNLQLVTIDGEDARDFDDAVFCEKKRGGGWRLWVAIADVSYYVRPNTPLDDEARGRGTSVYFPSQVIPMLPEVLSNGLCSLNPQVDRLCMVCEMTISAQGRLSSYKFYEAVMNSHARLTYNKVWQILQGHQELRDHYKPLIKPLETLHEMYKALDIARAERGGISFETEEAKFIFNAERRIDRIEPVMRNDAHKLIEECMILANIAAARFVEKNNEPALYRVHDRPSNDHITALRSVLGELGLSLGGGLKPEPKDYAEMMNIVADRPDHEMLQTMLLRSMKQAIYDPENRGHFGLALQAYAHFTSPIRRYPDLALHRAIKYLLARDEGELTGRSTPTGGWHSELTEMLQLGQHCSMSERRADEATRDVADWLKCDFMQDHVGEVFSGIIASVTGFGFFVRLNELFIDGLVHVSTLDNDYYRYDNIGQRLIGESGGSSYRLGDSVEIRVEAVHMDERKIDFSLVSSKRQPRGAGKTERNRSRQQPRGASSEGSKPPRRRHTTKQPANFESDSVFRQGESGTQKTKPKGKASKDKNRSAGLKNNPASTLDQKVAGPSSNGGNPAADKPAAPSRSARRRAAAKANAAKANVAAAGTSVVTDTRVQPASSAAIAPVVDATSRPSRNARRKAAKANAAAHEAQSHAGQPAAHQSSDTPPAGRPVRTESASAATQSASGEQSQTARRSRKATPKATPTAASTVPASVSSAAAAQPAAADKARPAADKARPAANTAKPAAETAKPAARSKKAAPKATSKATSKPASTTLASVSPAPAAQPATAEKARPAASTAKPAAETAKPAARSKKAAPKATSNATSKAISKPASTAPASVSPAPAAQPATADKARPAASTAKPAAETAKPAARSKKAAPKATSNATSKAISKPASTAPASVSPAPAAQPATADKARPAANTAKPAAETAKPAARSKKAAPKATSKAISKPASTVPASVSPAPAAQPATADKAKPASSTARPASSTAKPAANTAKPAAETAKPAARSKKAAPKATSKAISKPASTAPASVSPAPAAQPATADKARPASSTAKPAAETAKPAARSKKAAPKATPKATSKPASTAPASLSPAAAAQPATAEKAKPAARSKKAVPKAPAASVDRSETAKPKRSKKPAGSTKTGE